GLTDIVVVDHLGSSEKWKNLVGKRYEEYLEKDALFPHLEKGHLKEIDAVVHLGACSSTTEQNASYIMENNYIYSKRLAEWALKNKKRFLYASSGATYGAGEMGYSDSDETTLTLKPLNVYGYSKHAFDLWVIKNKLQNKFVGFKFFNVFGPNEGHKDDMRSMVNKGYSQIKKTGKLMLFKSHKEGFADGEQKRDFIYVKDAIEIVLYFLMHPEKSGIFNIGTGNAQTWNDLAAALFMAMDVEPKVEYINMPEILRGKYQYFTEADLTKLYNINCEHKFFTLNDAVKDYVDYLKDESYL
ncbi:MAG: ADP-glyceromanno-heptose 6-epimerase, partial [Candidatus Omnitrophota bacterium]